MRHDLSDQWDERLLILQLQLEREPASILVWHWRGEARVLRFLLHRYGEIAPPTPIDTSAVADVPGDAATPEVSALERSLLRLALLIPIVQTKHSRPAPRERAEILERIKTARDEGRQIEATEELWLEELNAQARRHALRLQARQARWKRIQREGAEERERRRGK